MNNNLYMSTLLKAFDILDCFDDDQQEIGISDISAKVGLPVSSVHRIIQSLEFKGLLSQNQESKKYALGSKMLSYSLPADRRQIRRRAVPHHRRKCKSGHLLRRPDHQHLHRRNALRPAAQLPPVPSLPCSLHRRRPRVSQPHERGRSEMGL